MSPLFFLFPLALIFFRNNRHSNLIRKKDLKKFADFAPNCDFKCFLKPSGSYSSPLHLNSGFPEYHAPLLKSLVVYSKMSGQNVLVSITVKSEAALECQKVENELKYYKINIHSV